MIKWVLKYGLIFIVCIFLQVFIFNEMQFSRFFNPSFYVLFILLLPFETPRWLLLISGFVLGLIIDAYTNTLGINAAASVFAAFIRPGVLTLISPRDDYELNTFPRLSEYGLFWFLKYTLIIVFAHQIVLFFLEAFTFRFLADTLFVILINSLLTSFFIILSQFIMFRK